MRALILSSRLADPRERQTLRDLASLGWELTIAIPGGRAETDGPLRIAPIPVGGPDSRPEARRWRRRALRRLLTEFRPDLVHIEEEAGTHGAQVASREADRLKIPLTLASTRALPRPLGVFARRRRAATMARMAGVSGASRAASTLLSAESPRALAVTLPPSGISARPLAPRPLAEALRIAFVGRLVPERGPEALLRACGQLLGPWSLVIAGTGPDQARLEALASKLGLAARTRWLGVQSRDQVRALWQEVDCLVVPSQGTPGWTEEWHPALVEAMAHEVACVVRDEGVLAEVVGEAGVVVRSEEDLLVALQELVVTMERRLELAEAARRRALDRFVHAAVARDLDRWWREVLASRPRAP